MSEEEAYLVPERVGAADGAAADDKQPRDLLVNARAVNTGQIGIDGKLVQAGRSEYTQIHRIAPHTHRATLSTPL